MKNDQQQTLETVSVLHATERQVKAIERLLESNLLDDVTVAELRGCINSDLTRLGASLLIELLRALTRWQQHRAETYARLEEAAQPAAASHVRYC